MTFSNQSYTILFSLFLLLFLGSCEKDQLLPTTETKSSLSEGTKPENYAKQELVILSTELQQSIKGDLLISAKGAGEKDSKEDAVFEVFLDTLLASRSSRISSDTLPYDVYSYFIPTEDPTYIVNAIFKVEDNSLTGGYVNVFQMTIDFASAFNSFSAELDKFEGELRVLPLSSLKELVYESGQKSGESDCFTYILQLTPRESDGGGGGGGEGGPGRVVLTDGPIGGGSGGGGSSNGCILVQEILCPCEGHGVGDKCGCGRKPYMSITPVPCSHKPEYLVDENTNETSLGKSLDIEECSSLLASVGIVPRLLSTPVTSALTLEQISVAISQTCFDENAVMDMIAPPAFEVCYDEGTPGPVCITNQVVDYLDASGIGDDPNSPISLGFGNLSHDQLAPFLHALIATRGNEHVFAGASAVRFNLGIPAIASSIADQILLIAQLHRISNENSNYSLSLEGYLNLLDDPESSFSFTEMDWLTSNPEETIRISDADNTITDFDQDYVVNILQEEHGSDLVLDDILDPYVNWLSIADENYVDTPDELDAGYSTTIYNRNIHQSPFSGGIEVATFDCTQCPSVGEPGYGELREDLRTDLSIEGIKGAERSEAECLADFQELLQTSSMFSSPTMADVVQRFVIHLMASTGDDYYESRLNTKIINTPEVINMIKYFGDEFNDQIHDDFTFDENSYPLNKSFRPTFNGYKTTSLTILLNDTESTSFRILDYSVDQTTGDWRATVGIEIIDHFGLDRGDVEEWQYKSWERTAIPVTTGQPTPPSSITYEFEAPEYIGDGFSAWYLLQHKFKNKPFRTILRFTAEIGNNVNN